MLRFNSGSVTSESLLLTSMPRFMGRLIECVMGMTWVVHTWLAKVLTRLRDVSGSKATVG